jgi:hypothetical protein
MSTSKIILRNRHGAEVAVIFFDEDSGRWRIVSKAEPKFKHQRGNSTCKTEYRVYLVLVRQGR